jgi:hypothetical protein
MPEVHQHPNITRLRALLPLMALGTILLTGCSGFVQDFKNLEAFAKSPNVSYNNADAWRCDLTKSTSTKGEVQDCGACVNVDRSSQAVTINGERVQVEPQGVVMRCSDRAWVRNRTMPPLPPKAEGKR